MLACTRTKSRRTLSGASTLPRGYISSSLDALGTFNLFSPALAQSRGGLLYLSRLKTREGVEVFNRCWCLRSPKDDEDFKTLNVPPYAEKRWGL